MRRTGRTKLDEPVILVSGQLTDWHEKSARQANELAEYMIEHFSVDTSRVYAAGYSAGGGSVVFDDMNVLNWVFSQHK